MLTLIFTVSFGRAQIKLRTKNWLHMKKLPLFLKKILDYFQCYMCVFVCGCVFGVCVVCVCEGVCARGCVRVRDGLHVCACVIVCWCECGCLWVCA